MQESAEAASADQWLADGAGLAWAFSQTNAALRTASDALASQALLRRGGLPAHPDSVKSWDTCLALVHAVTMVDVQTPVLDAGAERYSTFLPALERLGYSCLTGINLAFTEPQSLGAIRLEHGDVTRTRYPDGAFGFIACLSVIEHGVDLDLFFAEAARLLRPGGGLFVSFDYWASGCDTRGQSAYGVPIRIFDHHDVSVMLDLAGKSGLFLEGGCDFGCDEQVVHWQRFGLRYTFANLLLRKPG